MDTLEILQAKNRKQMKESSRMKDKITRLLSALFDLTHTQAICSDSKHLNFFFLFVFFFFCKILYKRERKEIDYEIKETG